MVEWRSSCCHDTKQIQEEEHLKAVFVSECADNLIHSCFKAAGDSPVEQIATQQQASKQRRNDSLGPDCERNREKRWQDREPCHGGHSQPPKVARQRRTAITAPPSATGSPMGTRRGSSAPKCAVCAHGPVRRWRRARDAVRSSFIGGLRALDSRPALRVLALGARLRVPAGWPVRPPRAPAARRWRQA